MFWCIVTLVWLVKNPFILFIIFHFSHMWFSHTWNMNHDHNENYQDHNITTEIQSIILTPSSHLHFLSWKPPFFNLLETSASYEFTLHHAPSTSRASSTPDLEHRQQNHYPLRLTVHITSCVDGNYGCRAAAARRRRRPLSLSYSPTKNT